MIQRLIILGLLKQGSLSGYDIKKNIEKDLGIFSNVESQSVYYPLRQMEREGLIKKRGALKKKHLKKYIYSITPRGEREFFTVCKNILVSHMSPFIELDIVLLFLPFLNKKEIMPLLRLRSRFLESVKQWLTNKEKEVKNSPHLALLIQHHFILSVVEREFIKDVLRVVKN